MMLTAEELELVNKLEIFDQTFGCTHCGKAWWGEDATPKPEDFHADDCPLKGRRDIHEAWGFNYAYYEQYCHTTNQQLEIPMSSPLLVYAVPTAEMQAVGLSFVDVVAVAEHVVHLLETQGKTALEVVSGLLKLVKAVSGRDMLGVFQALRELQDDVTVLIAAVKAEFGL